MGKPPCEVNPNDTELDFIDYRIGQIQGLELCKNLLKLYLRKNVIKKIEGLDNCV